MANERPSKLRRALVGQELPTLPAALTDESLQVPALSSRTDPSVAGGVALREAVVPSSTEQIITQPENGMPEPLVWHDSLEPHTK